MIKASEKFKVKLRRTLQATRGVLGLPNLSPLQRHYYGDIWELLQRLRGMIYFTDESEEVNVKTDAEIEAEIEKEELEKKLEEAEFRVQQLTNSNSHRMYKSLLEKLENVSRRLSQAEDALRRKEQEEKK